jgi:pyrimidine operon attenuation protein / uracil phosphoribosyltransferase
MTRIEAAAIDGMIGQMAADVRAWLGRSGHADPLVVGIHTGGLWVAERLRTALGLTSPLGELNIAFYRDDFSRIGMHPHVSPSRLPLAVEDRHLVLVDDVLNTGRTIRAAMNEIFDWGRPASICLAVLVERGGRELPIQADVIGRRLDLAPEEHVKLLGPVPLALEIKKS